jgi:hypothetical protein
MNHVTYEISTGRILSTITTPPPIGVGTLPADIAMVEENVLGRLPNPETEIINHASQSIELMDPAATFPDNVAITAGNEVEITFAHGVLIQVTDKNDATDVLLNETFYAGTYQIVFPDPGVFSVQIKAYLKRPKIATVTVT